MTTLVQEGRESDPTDEPMPPGSGGNQRLVAAIVGLLCLLTVASLVVALAYLVRVRAGGVGDVGHLEWNDIVDVLLMTSLVALGALIVLRSRARRYGWLLVLTGVVGAVSLAAGEFAVHAWYIGGDRSSPMVEFAIWLQDNFVWFISIVLLLPTLFPDGRPVQRGRRPLEVASTFWAVWLILWWFGERPAENLFLDLPDAPDNPAGVIAIPLEVLNFAWLFLMVGSVVISIGSLVTRWRTSGNENRQQLKWVLLAFAITGFLVMLTLIDILLVEVFDIDLLGWINNTGLPLAGIFIVVAIGLGVLKYRLYDVDLVINRTLVYGAMTVLVVLTYGLVVVGAAGLLPDVSESGASLLATGAAAVAFAPARSRVQNGVDRWMFGRSSDPYGVLSDVGATVAAPTTPGAALEGLAATVVEALKLPGAAIELDLGEDRATAGAGGGPSHGNGATDTEGGPTAFADMTRVQAGTIDAESPTETVPLRHQGEVVGRMVVARRSPSEPLRPDDLRLLESVAHLAAALANVVRLNHALQQSREGIVLAREEERRRLRRDLHDGLGPSLASQTFRLDAALRLVHSDSEAAAEQLCVVKEQNGELVADIRRLVHELRPPLLDEMGLEGALVAQARQLSRSDSVLADVTVQGEPLGDLSAAVEVAAYRIASEALTNTARHAHARRCEVALACTDHTLTVRVTDDGVGIGSASTGVGMVSMRERVSELGGSLDVQSDPGAGTVVVAKLPLADSDAPVAGG